jgi:hypothetical protein
MIDPIYLADLIRVVLTGAPFPHLDRAVQLLLATAAQESNLKYFYQLGGGPGRGLWQMEPATERDHWTYMTRYRAPWQQLMHDRSGVCAADESQLARNIPYGILMARLHYYRRDPKALPEVGDIEECWLRYKKYWNTEKGKATREQFMQAYETLIAPYWPATIISTARAAKTAPAE